MTLFIDPDCLACMTCRRVIATVGTGQYHLLRDGMCCDECWPSEEIDRYPLFLAALKETTMTAFGVVPHHPPVPAYCGARDDDTGRLCDLDQGHDGPHQTIITITWLDEDEPL